MLNMILDSNGITANLRNEYHLRDCVLYVTAEYWLLLQNTLMYSMFYAASSIKRHYVAYISQCAIEYWHICMNNSPFDLLLFLTQIHDVLVVQMWLYVYIFSKEYCIDHHHCIRKLHVPRVINVPNQRWYATKSKRVFHDLASI